RADILKNANQRQAPDHTEQTPSPRPPQCDQAEGCIAASNQQVDGEVIHLAKYVFSSSLEAVVQGGDQIQQDKRSAINCRAGDAPGVSGQACHDNQPGYAAYRQNGTEQV